MKPAGFLFEMPVRADRFDARAPVSSKRSVKTIADFCVARASEFIKPDGA